jgi:hypothetical protein
MPRKPKIWGSLVLISCINLSPPLQWERIPSGVWMWLKLGNCTLFIRQNRGKSKPTPRYPNSSSEEGTKLIDLRLNIAPSALLFASPPLRVAIPRSPVVMKLPIEGGHGNHQGIRVVAPLKVWCRGWEP